MWEWRLSYAGKGEGRKKGSHQNELGLERRTKMDWHGRKAQDLGKMRIVGLVERTNMR